MSDVICDGDEYSFFNQRRLGSYSRISLVNTGFSTTKVLRFLCPQMWDLISVQIEIKLLKNLRKTE